MQITIPMTRPIISIIGVIMAVFCCQAAAAAPQVTTDKDVYHQGETIRVNFFNSPGNDSDWICIVPAGAADTDAGDYQYMPKKLREGVLSFDLPAPGKYEVRAYYDYRRNGYVVTARHGFSVVAGIPPAEPKTASPAGTGMDTGKTAIGEESATGAASGTVPRYNVSVFHFKPVTMDASRYGIIVTNTLINAPRMQTAFVMMGRKDLESFLAANDLQQNDQIENVTGIGSKLGLNFVIAGTVDKRGAMIVANCKVISIEQRKVVFTHRSTSMGEADLINNITKMSDAIIEAILRGAS